MRSYQLTHTQTLDDTGTLKPRVCRFLNMQVQAIWVDVLSALMRSGIDEDALQVMLEGGAVREVPVSRHK